MVTIIRLIPRFIYFNQFKKVLNRKKTIIIGNEIDCYRFIKFNENKTDIEFQTGKLSILIDDKNSIHMKGPVSEIKEIEFKL